MELFNGLNGTNVKDSLCLDIPGHFEQCYTEKLEDHINFFLVQNVSNQPLFGIGQGIVGLAPRKKKTAGSLTSFGEYLASRNLIEDNTVSFLYNGSAGISPKVIMGDKFINTTGNTREVIYRPFDYKVDGISEEIWATSF